MEDSNTSTLVAQNCILVAPYFGSDERYFRPNVLSSIMDIRYIKQLLHLRHANMSMDSFNPRLHATVKLLGNYCSSSKLLIIFQ